ANPVVADLPRSDVIVMAGAVWRLGPHLMSILEHSGLIFDEGQRKALIMRGPPHRPAVNVPDLAIVDRVIALLGPEFQFGSNLIRIGDGLRLRHGGCAQG